jgi:hypothetical protein
MLTGLHPMRTGVLANAMTLRPEFETLAEAFRAAGYATAAATGVYHLSGNYGFDQGFERFTSVAPSALRRGADAVNADVLRVIRDHGAVANTRPLFLFVHYFDVHAPYLTHPEPTDYGRPVVSQALVDQLSAAYDVGVRSVDERLREVWTALERSNLAANTVLAITADHGEQIGEHGFTGGHVDLYRETIRVPLIIAGPGITQRRIPGLVSLMDLAPTLLDFAGLRFAHSTEGRSLLRELKGEPASYPARGLVVLGYPSYARSVAWRDEGVYFVRNFEPVYKSLSIAPASASAPSPATAPGRAPWRDEGDRRVFTIPAIDIEPFGIRLDIEAVRGCAANVVVSIAPGIDLSGPLQINGPTRLEYSLARLDSSFVTVNPRSCVKEIAWRFTRLASSERPADTRFHVGAASTRLFDVLSPSRKNKDADELFDVMTDPAMTNDVIDGYDAASIGRLRAALEARFVGYRLDKPGDASLSSDERERLRSLGYIK